MHFLPQPVRQIAEIRSHADDGRKPVIRVSLELVEQIIRVEVVFRHASVFLIQKANMDVDVDQRGNDGLSGQVDMHGASRSLHFIPPTDCREATVFHNEGRALDGRFSIAHNEPRTFKDRKLRVRSLLQSGARSKAQKERQYGEHEGFCRGHEANSIAAFGRRYVFVVNFVV